MYKKAINLLALCINKQLIEGISTMYFPIHNYFSILGQCLSRNEISLLYGSTYLFGIHIKVVSANLPANDSSWSRVPQTWRNFANGTFRAKTLGNKKYSRIVIMKTWKWLFRCHKLVIELKYIYRTEIYFALKY